MDVGNQCGVPGRACLFLVQLALVHVVAIWTKRNLIFLLVRVNLKIWGSCSKSMLCKVPNFLGKSTFDHKTNNSALAVKWQMRLANGLPSHGPGNEETSRKWGTRFSGEVLRRPPDHSRRHLRGKLRIARKSLGSATVFLSKMNLKRGWTVCSLAWEAALKILNHGKRVNRKISVAETL